MVETIESRVKKLEGKSGPGSTEPCCFTVYLIETQPGGTVRRVNTKTGKSRVVSAADLGIEPWLPAGPGAPVQREPPARIEIATPAAEEPQPTAIKPAEELTFEEARDRARNGAPIDWTAHRRFQDAWDRMGKGQRYDERG